MNANSTARALDAGLLSRRRWFERMATGVSGLALTHLLKQELGAVGVTSPDEASASSSGTQGDFSPRRPHFPGKARSIIQLFMNGGPSQMDLFDSKPMLDKHHGEPYFAKIAGEVENVSSAGSILRSPFPFKQHGQSGQWVSELLPHLAREVDDLAIIRSMHTTSITHEPALYVIHSGQLRSGHPSLGSWCVYGMGSENQNLPAYVVLDDPAGMPVNGVENWTSGFLPPSLQGTRFRSQGSPILNLHPAQADSEAMARLKRGFLGSLDRDHLRAHANDPRLEARIASYELAARMQLAADEALSLSTESVKTLEAYGIGKPATDSYGRRCLLARRLVERGVRFIQIFINAQIWDHHTGITPGLVSACEKTDLPIATLLRDLKQRGLLESTLVVWGGEFGRLPIAQLPPDRSEQNVGRDHNKNAFTTWMAGAGIKGGTTLGETDELGFNAVSNRVSVPDWHATLLHLLGLHYDDLFVERNGLKERLTGVADARIIREILS